MFTSTPFTTYHLSFHNENSVLFLGKNNFKIKPQLWNRIPKTKCWLSTIELDYIIFLTRRLKNKLKKISKNGTAKAGTQRTKDNIIQVLKTHPVPPYSGDSTSQDHLTHFVATGRVTIIIPTAKFPTHQ